MDKDSIRPLNELLDKVRDIDGFPKGKDEDILELSDPPFYTACPNPYINDFIEEHGTKYDPENDDYEKKPFVSDVSEGKNDPIYNAFSYHTKVPHKAIMEYIKHYTKEEDIIFDGFCGSGMTGVAARMLKRNSIISEISPYASFIGYNYTKIKNPDKFEKKSKKLVEKIKKECSWLYETKHVKSAENTRTGNNPKLFKEPEVGRIEYVVWSDVFVCPFCENEFVFWNQSVKKNKVKKEFTCPHCSAELTKRNCDRLIENNYDEYLDEIVKQAKQVPVLINYKVGNKRYEKNPDEDDLKLIEKIENSEIPYWFPTNRMPEGYNTEQPKRSHGYTHVHHFYTKRNLWVISAIWDKLDNNLYKILLLILLINNSKMSRYGARTGNISGTLYVPSLIKELNVIEYLKRKLYGPKGILKPIKKLSDNIKKESEIMVSTSSMTNQSTIKNGTIDYIFTDPPFGKNLMYSELNFINESWLKVFTNNEKEAIINKTQNKDLYEYEKLMRDSFKEMYRILKPNRWITVEFHNSKASVWNAIQEAMTQAGFMIAQVSVLDKKQGSFKQVTSPGAVKNDLVISAYKPKKDFEEKFIRNAGEGLEFDFIKEQLEHLPIKPNIERSEKMLYSKMLAHYVENGYRINYDAMDFYNELIDHPDFVKLDGFWFLDNQVEEYNNWKSGLSLDKIKEKMDEEQKSLFIEDEASAITWIYQFLDESKSYSDIYTAYQQVSIINEDDIPELRTLLEKNFIFENEKYRRPKTKKEEKELNNRYKKDLDKEFNKILDRAKNKKNKIKKVRKEALKHGFTKCYNEKKYKKIITIGDKLYKSTLRKMPEVKKFYDIAKMKGGGNLFE